MRFNLNYHGSEPSVLALHGLDDLPVLRFVANPSERIVAGY